MEKTQELEFENYYIEYRTGVPCTFEYGEDRSPEELFIWLHRDSEEESLNDNPQVRIGGILIKLSVLTDTNTLKNIGIIEGLSQAIMCNARMDISIEEFHQLCNIMGTEPDELYIKLNEIDLRKTQFLALDCKIKNMSNPIVEEDDIIGKAVYSQYVEIYDEDTSIIIKARFGDKCADFDKWKNGDHVKLIGRYHPTKYHGGKIQLLVSDAVKIEESDEPITITREDEVPGYDNWRKQVLSRDNQQCVCCGLNKHLEVHHLFGYKENPELAVNENNGVTLCKFCHDKYHSVYGLKNINPVDFIDFIKRFGVK